MKMKADKIKIGSKLVYNDSRHGHTNVVCEVVSVLDSCMVVQFEDRADTTQINFNDSGWMKHLKPCAS